MRVLDIDNAHCLRPPTPPRMLKSVNTTAAEWVPCVDVYEVTRAIVTHGRRVPRHYRHTTVRPPRLRTHLLTTNTTTAAAATAAYHRTAVPTTGRAGG